jgi:DNA-binding transcriptional regulator YiaG
MKQSLKDKLERLGPIRGIDRVSSGSLARVEMVPAGKLDKVRTIDAVHALVKYGVGPRVAKIVVERMVEDGCAEVSVPLFGTGLIEEMQLAGIAAKATIRSLKIPNVATLRRELNLSTLDFATRYYFNPRTVEGWEQGRPMDDAARVALTMIAADPKAAAEALRKAALEADAGTTEADPE